MKPIYRYSFIVLCITFVILWLYTRNYKSSTTYIQKQAFSIDTSFLEEIIIKDSQAEIQLKRTKNGWLTSEGIPVRREALMGFLEAQKRIQAKAPASESLRQDVIRQINLDGTEVIIRESNGGTHHYFLVYDESHETGTYLLLSDMEIPYQIFLPGYSRKELVSLYPTYPGFWHKKVLPQFVPENIASVSVFYSENHAQSFRLQASKDGFSLWDESKTFIKTIPLEQAYEYLDLFRQISYNQIIHSEETSYTFVPFSVVDIIKEDDTKVNFTFHNAHSAAGDIVRQKIYVQINNSSVWYEVSFTDVALIFQTLQDF